jgi:hypothetical protein
LDWLRGSAVGSGFSIKGGQLTVTQPKIAAISNIHVWTSAFLIFMGFMLEKWPNKGALVVIGAMQKSFCMFGCKTAALW